MLSQGKTAVHPLADRPCPSRRSLIVILVTQIMVTLFQFQFLASRLETVSPIISQLVKATRYFRSLPPVYHFRLTTSGRSLPVNSYFQLNLKDNEEIEFELNCYGPDNFEVTKIEKLRPGSLQFEFKTDLDNQDRDQGIILRMPESGPSGQPGKIEYRNNADACQYLDFEMDDIIPLKTISIRVSQGSMDRSAGSVDRRRRQFIDKYFR